MAHDLLVIAVGPLTRTASLIEVRPRLGAALDRPDQARMVFETHAMTVAPDAEAVWAVPLFLGWTWQATDILAALGLVVVAVGMTQTATRGIGRTVWVVTAIEQRSLIEMLMAPVVGKDGDSALANLAIIDSVG